MSTIALNETRRTLRCDDKDQVPSWEISLPYLMTDEERARIPKKHRYTCFWTCKAKMNHPTKSKWNGRVITCWEATPTLALMQAMNLITHIMDGADFLPLERYTSADFAKVCLQDVERIEALNLPL